MSILHAVSEDQKAMIHILEEAIKEVRAGRMITVGIVACMEKGPAYVMAGRHAAHLYLGCGMMQDEIKEKCRSAGEQALSSIIIPQRGPRR